MPLEALAWTSWLSSGATMKLLKLVPVMTLMSDSPEKRDCEMSAEKS